MRRLRTISSPARQARILRFPGSGLCVWLLSLLPTAAEIDTLRPEHTDWNETSRHVEVVDFLKSAASGHPRMHYTTMGYSMEGRELPLLLIGMESMPTPKEARESGLLRIYLQGNIHAGEAAGKEALLRLVRSLAMGNHPTWTKGWILLINPNYNPDGNERVNLENRLLQHGPIGGMGTRENAQGLDLNRDQNKLDSPEARSLTRLLTEWDPHVLVDLHTTNGTHHGYHLTYSPPLHPATPAEIDNFLRDTLLPEVSRRMVNQYGWHTWHYGNINTRDGVEAWRTFDPRPRYVTNYVGLRNRIAILSEAYSYLTFKDRVLASERFVEEILTALHSRKVWLVDRIQSLDTRDLRGREIPLTGRHAEDLPVREILLGEVTIETHPYTGGKLYRRTDDVRTVELPASIQFEPHHSIEVPEAYLLSTDAAEVAERLRAHGILIHEMHSPWTGPRAFFRVESIHREETPFQGRREVGVEGSWISDPTREPVWGYRIPMNQPLARLAVVLLEPMSDDGLLNWGFYNNTLLERRSIPLWRIPTAE